MCLECFIKFSETNQNCHICRVAIDYNNIKFVGGNVTLFYKDLSGKIGTIYKIDLEKMTSKQLYQIIELKMYGRYFDALNLIYGGRLIIRNDIALNISYPIIKECSTLHVVSRLRGD
jgi:hypothetical protein